MRSGSAQAPKSELELGQARALCLSDSLHSELSRPPEGCEEVFSKAKREVSAFGNAHSALGNFFGT